MGCHTMRRFMVVAVRGPGIRIVERVFSVALLRCRCSGCCWAEKLQLHPTIAHHRPPKLGEPEQGVTVGHCWLFLLADFDQTLVA